MSVELPVDIAQKFASGCEQVMIFVYLKKNPKSQFHPDARNIYEILQKTKGEMLYSNGYGAMVRSSKNALEIILSQQNVTNVRLPTIKEKLGVWATNADSFVGNSQNSIGRAVRSVRLDVVRFIARFLNVPM